MGAKFIFITGGVVSSVGKGVTAAPLGRLLKQHGFIDAIQKLDSYMNVHPGLLSSLQHEEVSGFIHTALPKAYAQMNSYTA